MFDFVNVMNSYIAIPSRVFFFCLVFTFKQIGCWKCEYNHKALPEKCKALKDLEKRMSEEVVAAKYCVPKNTL